MNEKTFNKVKRREVGRFRRAVGQAVEQLLAEKYEQTREVEEYRAYVRTCEFVKNLMSTVDLAADRVGPLFERQGERTKWEIYLSGLRKLFRDLPDSYLFRFVLPMFGLEEFEEKMVAYSGRWLDGLHAGHRFFGQTERYLANLERGENIMSEYEAKQSEDLARLYASLKTWESQEDAGNFFDAMADFVDTTIEVVIAGPVHLYLMLGRDTFLVLFKSLNIGNLGSLREEDEEFAELLALHDYLHQAVEQSTTLTLLQEVSARAGKAYVQAAREEAERMRSQLPTQDLKRNFVRRYEAGVLFQPETEELD